VTAAIAAVTAHNKKESEQITTSLGDFQKRYLNTAQNDRRPLYQVQLAVCSSVNELLQPAPQVMPGADSDAVWAKANDRLRVLDKLQKDVAAQAQSAAAQAGTGAPQPPATDAWTVLLETINRSVLPNMAAPLLRYEAASVMHAWPNQAQDWEARVSELARDPKHQQAEDAAARKFRKRPRVPMAAGDENFDDRYHPPIVKGLIDLQAQVERYLKPDTKEQPLERDSLAALQAEHREAFDKYVNSYLDYWGNTVVQELQIPARSWDEFKKEIAQTRADRVQDALRTLSDRITDAAKIVGERGGDLEKNISKSRDTFEGRSFEVACKTALDRWQRLTREADPRARLLDLKPEHFKDYECGVEPSETFLIFWASLPRVGLRCLADQAVGQLQADLANLQQLERFPLVLPKGGAGAMQPVPELSLAEVEKARTIITRLLGSAAKEDTLATVDTGNADFDAELARMRTRNAIEPPQYARLTMMRAVVDGLPRNGRLSYTLTAQKGPNDGFIWPHATVKQAGAPQGRDVTLRGDDRAEVIGNFNLPGEALTFEFGNFAVGNRQVATSVVVGDARQKEQWGILRLLLDPACSSAGGGEHGRAWAMIFRAPRPNDQQVITLQVNFNGNGREGMFPSRADWETLRVGALVPAVAPAHAPVPAPARPPPVAPAPTR
jgi:hypothetical protein